MLYRVAGELNRQDNEERDSNEEATEKILDEMVKDCTTLFQ